MRLSDFDVNKQGIIREVKDSPVAAKLLEFGILPGAHFFILNKSVFHGPIFLKVGDNKVAIRRQEADVIIVE